MTTDGTGLLSASWDSSCRLWRVEAGETFACKCRYALDNYGERLPELFCLTYR